MVRVRLPTADGNTHIQPIGLYITFEQSPGVQGAERKQIFVRFNVGYMQDTTFVAVHQMEKELDETHIAALATQLNSLANDLMQYMINQGIIQGTLE